MIIVRGQQAISTSIGRSRVSQTDPYFNFTDEYESFKFEGAAIFRKFYPGSMIITPRDTSGTGIFMFASVEWGNPVVLESIRATLFTSILNGISDIKTLWVILNDHLLNSFNICTTRAVIGKADGNTLHFVSFGLGFYRWTTPFEKVEILGLENGDPSLGAIDSAMILNHMKQQSQFINKVNIGENETILFLPDYLIFNHRWSLFNQLEEDDRGHVVEELGGRQMLQSLLSRDSRILTKEYFDSCFVEKFDFTGLTDARLFDYIFALDILNKGSSRKFLEKSSKWDGRLKEYFLCTQIELDCILEMVDKDAIQSIRKVKLVQESEEAIKYKVTCVDAVFPATKEFEDLAILKISR